MTTKRQRAVTEALQLLLPHVPYADALQIRNKANQPHLRGLPVNISVFLATTSYVRHRYTNYEDLLEGNLDRDAARYCVAADMEEKIGSWGGKITADELLAKNNDSGEQQ